MRFFSALIGTLSIPLAMANLLAGIGAGIWLAVLGQWKAIGLGLAVGLGGHLLIGFLLMPGNGPSR